MKEYWSIPGPSRAPQQPCIAFYKYDGNNIRAEWNKKTGWDKFGTRTRLLDETDPLFGCAIKLFRDKYANDLKRVIQDNKDFRMVRDAKDGRFIAFCELHGPTSFCGIHTPGEELTVTLIDIEVHKYGFLVPREFLRAFGHLDIAKVIYEGNFNKQFIRDVREGKYPVMEGVVAKGVIQGKRGRENHGLWMAKVKTNWWLEELRKRASTDAAFRVALSENVSEQAGDW